MASYLLTNRAVEDLTSIWNYTYDFWSEELADKYYGGLMRTCQKIADNPKVGKNYVEIDHSIFGYVYKKHIILYTPIHSEAVKIVRILHVSMDLRNRILDDY